MSVIYERCESCSKCYYLNTSPCETCYRPICTDCWVGQWGEKLNKDDFVGINLDEESCPFCTGEQLHPEDLKFRDGYKKGYLTGLRRAGIDRLTDKYAIGLGWAHDHEYLQYLIGQEFSFGLFEHVDKRFLQAIIKAHTLQSFQQNYLSFA